MRSLLNVLLLLAIPASLSGQVVTHSSAAQPEPAMSAVCPVSFAVELSSPGAIRITQSAQPPKRGSQLDLTFDLQDAPEIASMRVVVHGLTGNWHVSPVRPSSEEKTQSFELDRPSDVKRWRQASLKVTKLPFVNSAEITEITFVDHSMWRPAHGAFCQASPNPVQLIAASH